MDNFEHERENIFYQSEKYSKTTIELLKLKLVDKSINVISAIMYRFVLVIFMVLFFFIFNIGLSFLIGELLGHIYLGFFIVGGFYLVAGLLSHFFLHKFIIKLLINSILTQELQS